MQNILTKICNTKKDEIVEQKKHIVKISLLKILVNNQQLINLFSKKKYSLT